METASCVASKVGRKKRPIPARVVKMDADLVGTAEMLAKRQGLPVSIYLSRVLRPILDREFARLVLKSKKAMEGEGDEN